MKIKRFLRLICVCLALTNAFPTISLALGKPYSDHFKSGVCSPAVERAESGQEDISEVWDGTTASEFEGGSGTESDPYEIANGSQLDLLRYYINEGNASYNSKYYILTEDIYLNDTADVDQWEKTPPANQWIPIGKTGNMNEKDVFRGTFDGGGHTVFGIYCNRTEENTGLFGNINGGAVKNLRIEQSYVCGTNYVGALVGYASWGATVTNCYSSATVRGTDGVGGLIGYSHTYALYQYCCNTGSVTGRDRVGGILGQDMAGRGGAQLSCSYNTGSISGENYVGGIVGAVDNNSTGNSLVKNCYNTGQVRASTFAAGGIAGHLGANRQLICCYNLGPVSCETNKQMSGGVIGQREWISTCQNFYYIDSAADTDFGDKYFNLSSNGRRTEQQMQSQDTYSGFDFTNVWYFTSVGDYDYPRLYFPEDTIYCKILVRDPSDDSPVSDVAIAEGSEENIITTTDSNGIAYLQNSWRGFSKDTALYFSKSGYENFMCDYNDLKLGFDRIGLPDNYIYLTADGSQETDGKDKAYIESHVKFYNEKFSVIASSGFGQFWKNCDDGNELYLFRAWDVIGDIGEIVSLKFNDLTITANYYDLYIADLLLAMCENEVKDKYVTEAYDMLTNSFDIYKKTYDRLTNNYVASTINLLMRDDELKSEIKVDSWEDTLNEAVLGAELEKLITGKKDEMQPAYQLLYDKVFSKVMNDETLYQQFLEGAGAVNTLSTSYTDMMDFYGDVLHANIIAKSIKEVNLQFFDVLGEAALYMPDNTNTAKFKESLEKYKKAATNDGELMKYIITESTEGLRTKITDRLIKKYCKDGIYEFVGEALGVDVHALKILVMTYNGTYKLMDNITKLSNKGEQYYILYYNAPVEAALSQVTSDYGRELFMDPTKENAEKFDYAHQCLVGTNKYLYNTMYNYAALFKAPLTHNTAVVTSANELMGIASSLKNRWNTMKCHNYNIPINRFKYTSIQCPVDVYVYNSEGSMLVAIENEEITEYVEASITVLNCNGEKTIVYPSDENYSIKIVSREAGSMDYHVAEVDGVETVRNVEFYDIPLKVGSIYTGNIPETFAADNKTYKLTSDGEDILCDYDSALQNQDCGLGEHPFGDWVSEYETNTRTRKCSACGKQERQILQIKLSAPDDLKWETAVAKWNTVPQASKYSIQLYKDGEACGIAYETDGNSYDFSEKVGDGGRYTFSVTALGDGLIYLDSDAAISPKAYEHSDKGRPDGKPNQDQTTNQGGDTVNQEMSATGDGPTGTTPKKDGSSVQSPETGDGHTNVLAIAILLLSGLGIVAMKSWKRQKGW